MEQWEVRCQHEQAVVNAIFDMAGKDRPNHQYGIVRGSEEAARLIKHWRGSIATKSLNDQGHDSFEYEKCCCYKKYCGHMW